jgi:hypothetical protein
MAPKNISPKKERLTLAQLMSYDDILTDALVDHVNSRPVLGLKSNDLIRSTTGRLFGKTGMHTIHLEESKRTK